MLRKGLVLAVRNIISFGERREGVRMWRNRGNRVGKGQAVGYAAWAMKVSALTHLHGACWSPGPQA